MSMRSAQHGISGKRRYSLRASFGRRLWPLARRAGTSDDGERTAWDEDLEDTRARGQRERRALATRGAAAFPDSLPPVLREPGPPESPTRMPTQGDDGN